MPVGIPPLGGPLGRSRSRISASGLTTFLRCKRQWFLGSKVGISGPLRPSQVIGIVLEDALCGLMMRRPNVRIESLEQLKSWISSHIPNAAKEAFLEGKKLWDEGLWYEPETSWDDVEIESFESRLHYGLELFIAEVESCYAMNGGPHLEAFRSGNQPFSVPSPAWGDEPRFPVPDKVRNYSLRTWSDPEQSMQWSHPDSPVTWNEAWDIARPWMKDPRVHQPQRLFHPESWAAGELDLVLRWDGRIRLIDIKSGDPSSRFAESLQHQLRFYAWLWHETHDGQCVDGMEGWYLNGPHKVMYDAPEKADYPMMSKEFLEINTQMQNMGSGPATLPALPSDACDGSSAGCHWCSLSRSIEGKWFGDELLSNITSVRDITLTPPSELLSSIPERVSVQGKFTGAWGPLPNHFGEPVLGAMLVAGGAQITVEESEPGAYPLLHDEPNGDIVILDALPGVWRGSPRLYVDSRTRILPLAEAQKEFSNTSKQLSERTTRIGLLRTRANVEGIILSVRKRSGVRLDAKPWTMMNVHLWDGHSVVEVASFGSSITGQMESLRPGQRLKLMAAEIGWRAGLPQLRIDSRKTRLQVKD
ncbi:PD-(D/E)XK nuclease family protein [Euryarchaeota archaeon]|nr:PD-(D/E)XK nuclease family protein [Euryarchaeota archaeon]